MLPTANQLPTHYIQAFSSTVNFLAQQEMSRVWSRFPQQSLSAEGQFYDRLGQTAVRERTGTNPASPIVKQIHDRRRAVMKDYDIGDAIDNIDVIRMGYDPANYYVQNFAKAFARKFDEIAFDRLIGPAAIGKDGTESVAFDTTNRVAQIVSSNPAALTITALLNAKEILDQNEADSPNQERYFFTNAKGIKQLLQTTEISNADYNTVRALAMGAVNTFAGFTFIRTELTPRPAAGTQVGGVTFGATNNRSIFTTSDALMRVIGKDVESRVVERPDISFANYVYSCATVGAVRTEEVKVGEVYSS